MLAGRDRRPALRLGGRRRVERPGEPLANRRAERGERIHPSSVSSGLGLVEVERDGGDLAVLVHEQIDREPLEARVGLRGLDALVSQGLEPRRHRSRRRRAARMLSLGEREVAPILHKLRVRRKTARSHLGSPASRSPTRSGRSDRRERGSAAVRRLVRAAPRPQTAAWSHLCSAGPTERSSPTGVSGEGILDASSEDTSRQNADNDQSEDGGSASRSRYIASIARMPDALHFTGDPEADAFLAEDPLALLVGFALDQQVTVQKAFAGPLELRRRLGSFDAAQDRRDGPGRARGGLQGEAGDPPLPRRDGEARPGALRRDRRGLRRPRRARLDGGRDRRRPEASGCSRSPASAR